MNSIYHLNPFVNVNGFSNYSNYLNSLIFLDFFWIHSNFTNLISEVLINLFKFNFRPECFFFKLVTKRNTHADKRNNFISLKCSIFMSPMPNTSSEVDTKVVDLFIISLPNSVINSHHFPVFLYLGFLLYIKFLRLYVLKRKVPPTIKNYWIDHEDETMWLYLQGSP